MPGAPWVTADADAWASRVVGLPRTGLSTMRAALLVDPEAFDVAEESAQDNLYMATSASVPRQRARDQHRVLARALRAAGVPTLTLPAVDGLLDAVFPNNVYGFAPGVAILGSMRHGVRRQEAQRSDVRDLFAHTLGRSVIDLSDGPVGELTGVLAIDRTRGAAVCGLTGRCEPEAVAPMAAAFGLSTVLATPLDDAEYHLNVVLAVLEGRAAVVHDGAFVDPAVPAALDRVWPGAVRHLSRAEKDAFVANCLSIAPGVVAMSRTAAEALEPGTESFFADHGFTVLDVDVSVFELGGGSLRCMVAELF